MAGYGMTSSKKLQEFSELWKTFKWNVQIVPLSDLRHYDNWSAAFHVRFNKEKEIYMNSEKEDLLEILNKRLYKYLTYEIKFTKKELDTMKSAISSTVMSNILNIISGKKLLEINDSFPQIAVCLLWLLNDDILKERLEYEKKLLIQKLHQLEKTLSNF